MESKLTRKCNIFFKKLKDDFPGFFYQKISDRFTSGLPDYYLLFKGTSIWIELKNQGKRPRKIQSYTLKKLCDAGAITISTDSFEDISNLIENIVK